MSLLLNIRHLGRQPYQPVWRSMSAFTDAREASTPDEFWLLEHDPVFTMGQAGRLEHVLAADAIPVMPVAHGGQVTCHGVGQVVAYSLLHLRRAALGVRDLVRGIEQALIDTLGRRGIRGERRARAPGVCIGAAKIGDLGLRVS